MHCLVRACVAACLVFASIAQCAAADFTLAQVLDYPYPSGLVAAENGEHIAWVVNLRGARNVWVADGPAFKPRQVTQFNDDDGQGWTFSSTHNWGSCAAAITTQTGQPMTNGHRTRRQIHRNRRSICGRSSYPMARRSKSRRAMRLRYRRTDNSPT